MKISNLSFSTVLSGTSLLLALTAGLAVADTIKMKDGKLWEGTITAEDATSVTIKYMATPKIPDFKTLARADIASIEKKTPEDDEAAAVKKLLPTDDFLQPSAYAKLIAEGPAKFLAAHPTSKYKAEIEAVKKTLEDEMAQTRRNQRKVDGKWLSGEEIQANEYNINALRNLKTMEKFAAADKYRETLTAFVTLESTGKFSVSYPKAIELAKATLEKYKAALAQEVKDVPLKLKDAEDRLKKLNPNEVPVAKAEREKKKKDFLAQLIEEKKQKVKFTSTLDTEMPSLLEATRQVEAEGKRIGALNLPAITESAARYDKVLKLIAAKKFEEASARLDEFLKVTKDAAADPAIKRQVDDLKTKRAEAVREAQQRELLERSQPKPKAPAPAETPKPAETPAK